MLQEEDVFTKTPHCYSNVCTQGPIKQYLQRGVEPEVLPARERLEKSVKLRTEPHYTVACS